MIIADIYSQTTKVAILRRGDDEKRSRSSKLRAPVVIRGTRSLYYSVTGGHSHQNPVLAQKITYYYTLLLSKPFLVLTSIYVPRNRGTNHVAGAYAHPGKIVKLIYRVLYL